MNITVRSTKLSGMTEDVDSVKRAIEVMFNAQDDSTDPSEGFLVEFNSKEE